MVQSFLRPDDIKAFGLMVNGFSSASKHLANLLFDVGLNESEIESIVGVGPFNSLQDKDQSFIHYGPYITKPLSGLFGAFISVHFPELAMAKQLPALMGKAGFKLVIHVEMENKSIPLDQCRFGYKPRDGQLYYAPKPGRLILQNDPQNPQYVTDSSSARKFTTGKHGRPCFSIVDSHGKVLKEEIATTILWAHVEASNGLKKHGLNTPSFVTMALDGVDDDFQAERAIISCLNELKNRHHADFMPYFAEIVQRAGKSLNDKPEMLATIAGALSILKMVTDHFDLQYLMKAQLDVQHRHGHSGGVRQTIPRSLYGTNYPFDQLGIAVAMLDLQLPVTLPENLEELRKKVAGKLEHHVKRWRIAFSEEIKKEKIRSLVTNYKQVVRDVLSPLELGWMINHGYRIEVPPSARTKLSEIDEDGRKQVVAGIAATIGNSQRERLRAETLSLFGEIKLLRRKTTKNGSVRIRFGLAALELSEQKLWMDASNVIFEAVRKTRDSFAQKEPAKRPILTDEGLQALHQAICVIERTKQITGDLPTNTGMIARFKRLAAFLEGVNGDPQRILSLYNSTQRLTAVFESAVVDKPVNREHQKPVVALSMPSGLGA